MIHFCITEILLKVALKTFKPTKSTNHTGSSKPLVYISLYMLYLNKYIFFTTMLVYMYAIHVHVLFLFRRQIHVYS